MEDKGAPVERVSKSISFFCDLYLLQDCMAQSIRLIQFIMDEICIKIGHQFFSLFIRHHPHTHNKALCAGLNKGPTQSDHPFSGLNTSYPCLTGGKGNEFCTSEF